MALHSVNDFSISVKGRLITDACKYILNGGQGNDRLVGGAGNDTHQAYYIVDIVDGFNDFAGINDFQAGLETLVLHGSIGDYTVHLTGSGTDSQIFYQGDRIAILASVTGLDLSANAEFV
ncbi:MAG: hypothetical protein AAF152_03220 [Cyanobacteria bacterium P01_A01_bin.114]